MWWLPLMILIVIIFKLQMFTDCFGVCHLFTYVRILSPQRPRFNGHRWEVVKGCIKSDLLPHFLKRAQRFEV